MNNTVKSIPSDAIVIDRVSKSYGKYEALSDISFAVPQGEICGLLGPNGSGKSTLMNCIVGQLSYSGDIYILGEKFSPSALDKLGVSINGPVFYPHLSAKDNLAVHANLMGLHKKDIREVLKTVDLDYKSSAVARKFSTGMKSRLASSIALLGFPPILILDEPHNGLDIVGIRELRALLLDLAHRGVTILVSSHQLNEIAMICDSVVIISQGRLQYAGDIDSLNQYGSLEDGYVHYTSTGALA